MASSKPQSTPEAASEPALAEQARPSPRPFHGMEVERIVGEYGDGPGPLLFLLCGMHGNEPAGVLAARRVLADLEARQPSIKGRVVATAGNMTALRQGVRYVSRDLNRVWTWEQLNAGITDSETDEQREIAAVLARELDRRPEDIVLLDLHTTSAHGSPFTIISDTLRNRRFSFALEVPVILGLEENLQGTLLDFLGNYGCAAIGLEGGQHDAPETVGNHEAAIWITLVRAGLLSESDVPELNAAHARLRKAADGIPRVIDIQHREEIADGEDFTMVPGFRNFQNIGAGSLLAHTGVDSREVRSEEAGILIMPRYQGQGSDGFFLGRRIQGFWVGLSGILRRMKLSRMAAWLPGISKRRGPKGQRDFFEVDRRVARWFPSDIMHLFGYRQVESDPDHLVFARRVEHPAEIDRLLSDFQQLH